MQADMERSELRRRIAAWLRGEEIASARADRRAQRRPDGSGRDALRPARVELRAARAAARRWSDEVARLAAAARAGADDREMLARIACAIEATELAARRVERR